MHEQRQFEFTTYGSDQSCHEIAALINGKSHGILSFDLPQDESEAVYLYEIDAEPLIGLELLKKFVSLLNKDRIVCGSINHEKSIDWLAKNGFFNGVIPGYDRKFTNKETLQSFPVTRALKGTGLELLSLTTTYNYKDFENGDLDFPYQVGFIAQVKADNSNVKNELV